MKDLKITTMKCWRTLTDKILIQMKREERKMLKKKEKRKVLVVAKLNDYVVY
jgi:hypothetical protein